MESKKIAIIGAGISGLLACKYAMEKGFRPTVFEARNNIGGVWSQTIESTKLQTPKNIYQFSDFDWPSSATDSFPDHNQVMEYLQSYAVHFNILPRIKFNSRVVGIDYSCAQSDQNLHSWDSWGGTGEAFSPYGKWNVTVQDTSGTTIKVYEVDFVILCIGQFSDLPHLPNFPTNEGPEAFDGQVLHSMDYAAMDDNSAIEFIKDRQVTVVGFQKSALDLACEIASTNGVRNPCTLLFKKAYWMVPEFLHIHINMRNLNRFTELMIHKPREGFFVWFLVLLLSPLLWIFEKLVENCLKWTYPLKKYNIVPRHGYLKQVSSCMLSILPAKFYDRVREGSIVLKKIESSFHFYENGLILDNDTARPETTDVVIFATGYKSDEKLMNIFTSTCFQKCIIGSSLPFYRECIHPRIPQLAILGYAKSPATLFTTEMRSMWLSHFLAGKFKLPNIQDMEDDLKELEKCIRHYARESYKRTCTTILLQIHCNDLLCKDMGCNPKRKKWFFSELFDPYGPTDYKNLT